MKTRILAVLVPLALSALTAYAVPFGPNIVVNGDFETHPPLAFPPWQFSHGYNAYINEPGKVASGNNCVFIGGLSGGDLWQDLNTVAGQLYEFSFYERGDDTGQTERLSLLNVFWGSQEIGSYTDDNKVSGWNHYVVDVVAVGTTTRIDFQQASYLLGSYGYPGIDNVSVRAVPETASTISLLGLSFAACVGFKVCVRGGRGSGA
jgi:hypothetical protein